MMEQYAPQVRHVTHVATVGNFGILSFSRCVVRSLVGRMDQDASLVPHVIIIAAVIATNIGIVWG